MPGCLFLLLAIPLALVGAFMGFIGLAMLWAVSPVVTVVLGFLVVFVMVVGINGAKQAAAARRQASQGTAFEKEVR